MSSLRWMVGCLAIAAASIGTSNLTADEFAFGGSGFYYDAGGWSGEGYPSRIGAAAAAVQGRVHPAPFYAYGRGGIDATRTHNWNMMQSQQYHWHGNHYYWRWQRPTALVVPPTAAFHTVYSWGTAQTQSLPIYHQFGGYGAVPIDGAGLQFQPTPYWPSNTQQFGVYPVRAPW